MEPTGRRSCFRGPRCPLSPLSKRELQPHSNLKGVPKVRRFECQAYPATPPRCKSCRTVAPKHAQAVQGRKGTWWNRNRRPGYLCDSSGPHRAGSLPHRSRDVWNCKSGRWSINLPDPMLNLAEYIADPFNPFRGSQEGYGRGEVKTANGGAEPAHSIFAVS